MRKPVQVILCESGAIAVCDDGSMWSYHDAVTDISRVWQRLPDIPQDEPEQPATSPDVVDALRKLAKAEANFRGSFLGYEGDHFGNTRATLFRLQAQAGNAARKLLQRIDEQEEQR